MTSIEASQILLADDDLGGVRAAKSDCMQSGRYISSKTTPHGLQL